MSTFVLTSANFWQRWPLYQQTLRRLSRSFLGARSSDVEDAVAITLLRALQGLQSSSVSVHNERSWLIRILHNVCVDIHRHGERFVDSEPTTAFEEAEEGQDASPEVADSPEEALLARERSEELWTTIQTLPSTLRTPLIMRFYLDMSYPEISAALNLTNCNVRKRVQLASGKLRTRLTLPAQKGGK